MIILKKEEEMQQMRSGRIKSLQNEETTK